MECGDLHDRRLESRRGEILDTLAAQGLTTAVVNGTSEDDWPAVHALAAAHPAWVLPSFGLHPWFTGRRSPEWKDRLIEQLDNAPGARAGIGEIGLDKWIRGHDLADQTTVFTEQLQLGAARNLPVTIHCIQAWGALIDILEREPLPPRGFLLHAYGGPAEFEIVTRRGEERVRRRFGEKFIACQHAAVGIDQSHALRQHPHLRTADRIDGGGNLAVGVAHANIVEIDQRERS